MPNVPNGGLTAYHPRRNTTVVHDVIWGPTVSGKVAELDKLLAIDAASGLAESWLVDAYNAHPTWAGKSARSEADASILLDEALNHTVNRGQILVVTVSAASVVLQSYPIRAAVERLVNAGQVKLRLSVRTLDVRGFGGSELIRNAMDGVNLIKAVA